MNYELRHISIRVPWHDTGWPLMMDGVTKYPDFTIQEMESGETFYWEHCGMLPLPSYRKRWNEKLGWYRRHGIRDREDGGGTEGIADVTDFKPIRGLGGSHHKLESA